MKVELWNDMLSQHMSKDELAQLLDVQTSQVDNLFDLIDTSSYDLLEAAAKRLSERAALRAG